MRRMNREIQPQKAINFEIRWISPTANARLRIRLSVTVKRSDRTKCKKHNTSRSVSECFALNSHETSIELPSVSKSKNSYGFLQIRRTVLRCTRYFSAAWEELLPESRKCDTLIFSSNLILTRFFDISCTFSSLVSRVNDSFYCHSIDIESHRIVASSLLRPSEMKRSISSFLASVRLHWLWMRLVWTYWRS